MKYLLKKTTNSMKHKKIILSLIVCLACAVTSMAQGFKRMVSLPETQNKGFHKIIISPEISAKSAVNYADFRIFNAQKKEVPYIIRKDFVRKQHKTFVPYQLIAKSTPGDTATEIIVKNQSANNINNLCVFLNNAEVSKQIIISGSYNQKQWYAVKQNYNISGIANENNVTELNTIYFPLSDYTFYKILINDKNSLPVKVLKAGYYQDSVSYGEETLLKAPQIIRTENTIEHITTIQLNFDAEYAIDKIKLNINAPTLFRRSISIYALRNNNGKLYKEYIQETTLQAASDNLIRLDNIHAQKIIFEIKNDNNPLLEISQINCYQLSQYIIAYLEEKGDYILKFGNDSLQSPVYDLAYFENIIPTSIPIIETSKLSIINNPEKPVNVAVKPFYYNNKIFLWTAIVAVALLLLMITSKMLNEMKKKG